MTFQQDLEHTLKVLLFETEAKMIARAQNSAANIVTGWTKKG